MQATLTRPMVEEVWDWLHEVPDPEVPVISVVDLGIVRGLCWQERNGREALVVTITPTYSGCPATSVIALAIESALRAKGVEDFRLERAHLAAVDDGLDVGGGATAAQGVWRRPAAREGRNGVAAEPPRAQDRDGRMPSLRVSEHGAGQRVRLDAVQGPIPVPGLPAEPFDYFKCI